jgi:predicted RecB family nuclease
MTRTLSASRLNDFLGCTHQSALWLAGAPTDGAADPTLELIRQKGFAHEADVLARLEALHGPAVRIAAEGSHAARQAATLKAIQEGAALIYQGALANALWIGYPDFLVRQPGQGGGHTFEPEDAKLARKAKADYVLQLGIYAELLAHLTGIPVGGGAVHVAGGPPEPFDLRHTRYILKRLMAKFEAFVADTRRSTRAVPCAACAQCDYKARCEEEWRSADSPIFVAGLSTAQLLKLEEAGIRTLESVARLPPGIDVEGIGGATLTRLAAQARLQLAARQTGKHAIELLPPEPGHGFHLLPSPAAGDLYFDIEGDPLYDQGLEYLFGVWGPTGEGGAEAFTAFWAHSHAEEKAAFEALMRFFGAHLKRHPGAHIYHYAHYEPTALKRLAMRYATMEAELDQMLRERRFVDLYRVVRQGLRASTEGYSLKDLEKIYWDQRTGEVTTAGDSIVEYERWCATGDDSILEAIAAYNKHDCVSTAHMHRWLEPMRPRGCAYQAPDAGQPQKTEKATERQALDARKQALAARVRQSDVGDETLRDLVAELLWFHQRAQKPGWWAAFERQGWSDEELIDDAESLGAVSLDRSVPAIPVKRSLDTTYRFPPQDTKLKVGESPRIALTHAPAGIIVSLEPADGRLVLRRGVNAPPLPEGFGLISAPLDPQQLPHAVMAFAERFAANTLQSDRALMNFLLRRPPRLRGRTFGTPVLAESQDLVQGTMRAALDLDGSCLFVQGPPGTGKTYTIATVIVALLKAGYRVGVSSNSHNAIHKVLEEVEKQAAAARYEFVGVKKASADRPESEFLSTHIASVFRAEDINASHRLVGGTAFHFCRDDQRGAYDYLIVDEAGQVALGNLVAMAGAASNLILVGDQMQLPQPVQGVHPGETGKSSLEYLLQGVATVPPDCGILLSESWRLHPEICTFISDAIYDGRLKSRPHTAERYLVLRPDAHPALQLAGIAFVNLPHDGCAQSSPEEAETIAGILDNLLRQQVRRKGGVVERFTLDDVLVVAPYNMQVNTLRARLPDGTRVGTVDKFQGQEAPVVIVSMTTSRGEDAPRGTEFLFNPNRLNVAISRAQCLAILVCGSNLLEGAWRRIEDLRRVNLLAHAEAVARKVTLALSGRVSHSSGKEAMPPEKPVGEAGAP